MPSESRFAVVIERDLRIPTRDGVMLAGDLFRPAESGRFPAIVHYSPYQKDTVAGARLDHPNRYLAARGYASLVVDFRGLGGSEGARWEHMDPREGFDGADIVEWAAAQPWCDGNVGMWGMSYSAAVTLETAVNHPPHLKAVMAMCGDVDLYKEINYPGGCLVAGAILGNWGSWMIAMGLLPPMLQDEAGRWYRTWMERLERADDPHVFPIRAHPDYESYWQDRAVKVERIEVPAFFVAAWRDQNPDAMIGSFCRVSGQRRLIVGPWMHAWPDLAASNPIDYLHEMVRWWDAWLRNEPGGIRDEPPVTIFVQGLGWRHGTTWPIEGSETRTLFMDVDGALAHRRSDRSEAISYRVDPTVGTTAGTFDPAGTGLGMPMDQGPDDLRSITFTSPPLVDDLQVTGTPEALIRLACDDGGDVNVVVKLCDVAPSGASSLITTGWLRGAHWRSDEHPLSLPLGEVVDIRVPLVSTSYLVASGHRVRVSVSCADFPRIWPTSTTPVVRLICGLDGSEIRIPSAPRAGIAGPDLPVPDVAVDRSPLNIEFVPRYRIEHDMAGGTVSVVSGQRSSLRTPNGDGRLAMDRTTRSTVSATHPASARVEGEAILTAETPGGSTIVAEGRARITMAGEVYSGRLVVDGQVLFERRWTR